MSEQYPFVRSDYEPLIESVEGFLRSWIELAPRHPETINREGWLAEIRGLEIKVTDFGQYVIGGSDNLGNYLALVRHALTTYHFSDILGLGRLHDSGTQQTQTLLANIKHFRDIRCPFPWAANELYKQTQVRKATGARTGNVFVSHGRRTEPLSMVCDFVQALGLRPIVVEREPSRGRSVNQIVRDMLQSCDCAIIIGTAEQRVDNKWQMSQNVVNEVGLAQEALKDKIIYLKEDKVDDIPSNFREKVYETFTSDCMDRALIKITRELKAFGLI